MEKAAGEEWQAGMPDRGLAPMGRIAEFVSAFKFVESAVGDVVRAWAAVSATMFDPTLRSALIGSCHFDTTCEVTIGALGAFGIARSIIVGNLKRIISMELGTDLSAAAGVIALTLIFGTVLCGLPIHVPDSLSPKWVWVLLGLSSVAYLMNLELLSETHARVKRSSSQELAQNKDFFNALFSVGAGVVTLIFGVALATFP
jgi:hypothetical protein